jgi:hypothetical protein
VPKPIDPDERTNRAALDLAMEYEDLLSDYERKFVTDLTDRFAKGQTTLSTNQQTLLDQIEAKLRVRGV